MNEQFANRLHRIGDTIADLAQLATVDTLQLNAFNHTDSTSVNLSHDHITRNVRVMIMIRPPGAGIETFHRQVPPDNDLGAELAMLYRMNSGEKAEE